jgi:hypothetical protein
MHGPINVKTPNNTSKWQMGFNSTFKGLIMSVHLSVRIEQLGYHGTDFHSISHMSIFRKSVYKVKVPVKSGKNNGYLDEDLGNFVIISQSVLLRMQNVSV